MTQYDEPKTAAEELAALQQAKPVAREPHNDPNTAAVWILQYEDGTVHVEERDILEWHVFEKPHPGRRPSCEWSDALRKPSKKLRIGLMMLLNRATGELVDEWLNVHKTREDAIYFTTHLKEVMLAELERAGLKGDLQ